MTKVDNFIINKFIDEIAFCFSAAAWEYAETGNAAELEIFDTYFDWIDEYISSLPGGHDFSFFSSVNDLLKSKNITDEARFKQFSEFFRFQIKIHIREQIRCLGDMKVDGEVDVY